MSKIKVSLEWLKNSNDKLAKSYRKAISQGSYGDKCVLCCMFFGEDFDDGEGHKSKCSFDEIFEDELEHFQQMAKFENIDIEIVSLKYLPEENPLAKEKVEFT